MAYYPRTYRSSPQEARQTQQPEQFQPRYGAEQTRSLIQRMSKFRGKLHPQLQQDLEQHAQYHNIPFYTGEFSASEAIMQLA